MWFDVEILLFYLTLHIFVTKRILKTRKYLHTYIKRIILLVIRKLLYVGNLHLPTFTYIQHFDRIFPNTFRNFSRWFPQEVAVISDGKYRDFWRKLP